MCTIQAKFRCGVNLSMCLGSSTALVHRKTILLAVEQLAHDLVDLRVHQRLAAGDARPSARRTPRTAATACSTGIRCLSTSRRVLDLAAARALEVAGEQRLELDEQRELLPPLDLLLHRYVPSRMRLAQRHAHEFSTSPGRVMRDVRRRARRCRSRTSAIALASGPGGQYGSRAPQRAQRAGAARQCAERHQRVCGGVDDRRGRRRTGRPVAGEHARLHVDGDRAAVGPAGPGRAGDEPRRRRRRPQVHRCSPAIRSAVGQLGRPGAGDGVAPPPARTDPVGDHDVAGRADRRHDRAGDRRPATSRPPARQPPGAAAPMRVAADGQRLERGAGRRSSPGRLRVPAERGEREDQPVEVVVDGEVAGEAGAGELRLVPGAVRALGPDQAATPRSAAAGQRSPAASRASSAHAVCDAVEVPRPIHRGSVYERRSSPQPPSSFWCSSSQRTARRIAGSRGRDARPRPGPAPRRRCRRRGWRPSGRTRSRPSPARASSQSMPRRVARRAAAVEREHLDHVRGDVGGRRVDDLAEVAERQLADSSLVLSASKAPQPPSLLHPDRPGDAAVGGRVHPRPGRGARPRPGAARARPRRCRRCPGSCRWRTRTPSRRARAAGRRTAQSPRTRDLLAEQPVGAAPDGRVGRPARRRRAARSAPARCPRPATGRPRASAPAVLARRRAVPRRPESSDRSAAASRHPSTRTVNASSPGGPIAPVARAGAARSASRPTAAGCRPRSRRPPAGRGSSARPCAARAARSGRDRVPLVARAAPGPARSNAPVPGRVRPAGAPARAGVAARRCRTAAGAPAAGCDTTASGTIVCRAQQAKS